MCYGRNLSHLELFFEVSYFPQRLDYTKSNNMLINLESL